MRRMILSFAVGVGFASSASAFGQQPFEPFTMDQRTWDALQQQIGEVPVKWGLPMLNLLSQKELEAQTIHAHSDPANRAPPPAPDQPPK